MEYFILIAYVVIMTEGKLLKPGTTYQLGRKGCPLIIASKKISTNQGEFVVGPFTVNDVVRCFVFTL